MKCLVRDICLFLLFIILITSCKKNYSCDCTYSFQWANTGAFEEEDTSFDIEKSKKKDAVDQCSQYQEDNTSWNYTYECELNKI